MDELDIFDFLGMDQLTIYKIFGVAIANFASEKSLARKVQ
tara:strand:- start:338 stop:457 length:120 start_codon:yes stop_codon:yes gene_type:complete